jgi:alpha-mannosidase
MAFNNPLLPVSVVDRISRKSLPPAQSFVSIKADNVIVSTIKKAESGPAVLIRAYEIEGAPARSPIEFLGQIRRFRDVNLLEEDQGAQDQQELRANPYEIRTIKLR